MGLTTFKVNLLLFFKLPSAFFCGVRLKYISDSKSLVTVKHSWFNKNPFQSLYFAVQAMAAELTTGSLVLSRIRMHDRNMSILVANTTANFSKKAKGRITFTCLEGNSIEEYIVKAIETGEGQTFWMQSIGVDEMGDVVSNFKFEWTIKLKK